MLAVELLALLLMSAAGASAGKDKGASKNWPADVDAVIPEVQTSSPCPLDEILNSTSRRVRKLVGDMQEFSARETLEYAEIDRNGRVRARHSATFTYVADIHEVRPGQLAVDEYRDDSSGVETFPSRLATTGTAAFALILHPDYVGDFNFTCEGLARSNGRNAWQLHFTQRRINNFRGYRVATVYYPVELKGRVWIAPDSYEVLRLETDLLRPIPEIKLLREHVLIDYGPVRFPRHGLALWLPKVSTIFIDYRGRRYFHRHSFSDFQLFWVETNPAAKPPAGDGSASQ